MVRAALNPLPAPPAPVAPPVQPPPAVADPQRKRKPLWAVAASLLAGVFGLGLAALGLRPGAIAPVQASSDGLYSPQVQERGRQLAAVGNCAACHTAEGGAPHAGGRPMATPFGTVYSTNLTPDAATGIGQWSFSAFQRAMREGISRDGHRLYPAFPYTAYTQVTDDDLQALYAHLMAQPAVANPVPETRLAFPYNIRPLMGLWNGLYLQPGPVAPVVAQSPLWNRGAYLVNGLGHCTACHTPRDALGGELAHTAYLGGALVDGWEAPPLGALGRGPVPCTANMKRGELPNSRLALPAAAWPPWFKRWRRLAKPMCVPWPITWWRCSRRSRQSIPRPWWCKRHSSRGCCRGRRSACSTPPAAPATTTVTALRCWA